MTLVCESLQPEHERKANAFSKSHSIYYVLSFLILTVPSRQTSRNKDDKTTLIVLFREELIFSKYMKEVGEVPY